MMNRDGSRSNVVNVHDVNTASKVSAMSKRVIGWYHQIKDLSGFSFSDPSSGWFDIDALPSTLVNILRECGRMYAVSYTHLTLPTICSV